MPNLTEQGVANILASLALVGALASLLISWLSYRAAHEATQQTNRISLDIAQKQGAIKLDEAFKDVHYLDVQHPHPTDVRKAANFLDAVANHWILNITHKDYIYNSYWGPFQRLYGELKACVLPIPELGKTGPALLTQNIHDAYNSMQRWPQERLHQTKPGA